MSPRPTELLIEDILEAIEKIESYTAGLDKHQFTQDDKTIDAVVRNLEIIGEAASRLPEDFKSSHDEISWHQITGLRNRIVHEYFGVDAEIIWQILRKDLPELNGKLKDI